VLRRRSLYARSPDPTSKARTPTDTSDTQGTPPVPGSLPSTVAEADLALEAELAPPP
jgi:hypothetical protein